MSLVSPLRGWSLRAVRSGGHGAALCALLVAGSLAPAAAEPAMRGGSGWSEGFAVGGAGNGAGADSSPASLLASGLSGGVSASDGAPLGGSSDDEDVDGGGEGVGGEDDDAAVDCDGIDASTGSELAELLDCVSALPGVGEDASTSGGVSAQAQSSPASGCGKIDVEYLDQQFLPIRYGFILMETRAYVVRLTCEDGSPAENVRVGMRIEGPVSFFTLCTRRLSSSRITYTRASSGRCRSYTVGDPPWAGLIFAHTITNFQDLRFRRLVFWADLNSNGNHDPGEPYDLAFSPDDNTSAGFTIGDSDGLSVVRGGSRMHGSLTLENGLGSPLGGVRVGMNVVLGPSRGSALACVGNPAPDRATGSACLSDIDGRVALTYQVARNPNQHRQDMDVIRLYLDEDEDGNYDTGEPFTYVTPRIARVPNYAALGDSYSAGQAGDAPPSGAYQSGINPADAQCRRWDQAYPYILANYLGSGTPGATFKTFACTGALTLNIHDPADPNPTPPPGTAHDTDRPSQHAPLGKAVHRRTSPRGGREMVHERDPGWEPRQAVSLAAEQRRRSIDMITLTIGGNDSGFADVLASCVKPVLLELDLTCDESDLASGFERVGVRVADAVSRLREVAPAASVFVLGYPYVTPSVGACEGPEVQTRAGATILVHESEECKALFEFLENCSSLSARAIVNRSGVIGGALLQAATDLLSGSPTRVGRINFGEARFLWRTSDLLNEQIREAARRSGAHFVDVVGAVVAPGAPTGFLGHSLCAGRDAWLHGFVAKSGLHSGSAVADQSFHPNLEGQRGYAAILEQYIRDAAADGDAELNEAGLPVNPAPDRPMGHGMRNSDVAEAAAKGGDSEAQQAGDPASGAGDGRDEPSGNTADATAGYLVAQRVVALSGCGSPFVSPGEQLRLGAEGFASGASVSFVAQAVSLGDTALAAPTLSAATASGDGAIDVAWRVPSAPAVSVDASPRAYVVNASGVGPGGGTHTAYMIEPLVAYPGTAPCAVADTAATRLGRAVTIAVLSNDNAPQGGTLDATSVEILSADGGSFVANEATGIVTFTPDAGFYGTAEGAYAVYDNWGIGVRGDITVTVASGCTITGTRGVTAITGTEGDDVICVPDPDDRRAFHVIDARGGGDIVIGGAGVEWIYGGAGDDTVYGRGGDDRIIAGAGTDTAHGGAGRDYVYSADLADTVVDDGYEAIVAPNVTVAQAAPDASDDWQHAGAARTVTIDVLGNDFDPNDDIDLSRLTIIAEPADGTARVVEAGGGRAVEYRAGGSEGSDSFAYEICDALDRCDTARVTVMVGTAQCTIVGTSASETLYGTPGDDVICGLGGDDTIYGLGGNDIVVGGTGADVLYGGDGDDLLWGGPGDDTLHGGRDDDLLWGGPGDDTLHGDHGNDRIYGGAGDDAAQAGRGRDIVFGGDGADRVYGGIGGDTVVGGAGDDALEGGEGADTLYGGAGHDAIIGGPGADSLFGGAGDDALRGDDGDDVLWGGAGNDSLRGDRHQDQLHGGPGRDTLHGGDGADRVYGGAGADTLMGGAGNDYLNGGPGTDTCARAGGDVAAGCGTRD